MADVHLQAVFQDFLSLPSEFLRPERQIMLLKGLSAVIRFFGRPER